MYEQFYKLTAEPFRLSPDHRFCYSHKLYAKAKAYMAYAFVRAEGFVMITGDPGTGKTTLVGDLLETLAGEKVVIGNLVSTQLTGDDLLRMVGYAFDVDATGQVKAVVLNQLAKKFATLYRDGRRALLIVDEAQDLDRDALEELRLLTNLQESGNPLLQIFLLGQTEFRNLIHSPDLAQVHQRIVAASHLEALKPEETKAYVEHRLKAVGWRNDPMISEAVYPVVYEFSGGIPRRINLICSRLFLHCSVERKHKITLADAKEVVLELQDEQLSTRNLINDDIFSADDSFDDTAAGEPEPSELKNEKACGEQEEDSDNPDSDSEPVNSPVDAPGRESSNVKNRRGDELASDASRERVSVVESEPATTAGDSSAPTIAEMENHSSVRSAPLVIDDESFAADADSLKVEPTTTSQYARSTRIDTLMGWLFAALAGGAVIFVTLP